MLTVQSLETSALVHLISVPFSSFEKVNHNFESVLLPLTLLTMVALKPHLHMEPQLVFTPSLLMKVIVNSPHISFLICQIIAGLDTLQPNITRSPVHHGHVHLKPFAGCRHSRVRAQIPHPAVISNTVAIETYHY